MGWWASDTAQLFFDSVKIPVENLVGTRQRLHRHRMNFSQRAGMSTGAWGYARSASTRRLLRPRRHTFGKPRRHQVVRHRIVDMAMRLNAVKSTLELLAYRVGQGEKPVAEICMLKNPRTSAGVRANRGADFGSIRYLRGAKVRHLSRTRSSRRRWLRRSRDLAARQMGL